MSKLYVMVGIPNSGKSSFARQIVKQVPNTIHVSRDEIRFSLVEENEPYFSKEDLVFDTFVNTIASYLNQGKNAIADATHINKWSRYNLLESLEEYFPETELIAVFMRTPLDICLDRNETRKGTRTFVPWDTIRKMSRKLSQPRFNENGKIPFSQIIIVDSDKITRLKNGGE